jgi:hypothetical protein
VPAPALTPARPCSLQKSAGSFLDPSMSGLGHSRRWPGRTRGQLPPLKLTSRWDLNCHHRGDWLMSADGIYRPSGRCARRATSGH